jgi:GTPase SAR1 family protein
VLVYDVTKRQSFENMKNKWLSQLQDFGHEDMYIIIIGNKCDIDPSQHVVRQAEAAEFAGIEGVVLCYALLLIIMSSIVYCRVCRVRLH